ncbi:MAG: hypothetical protein H6744_21770 [Deltaproteobacteria bacterium]|nr:hypothetical protein [Deltaproteobacteria bacterium]MCB9789314.1 hypothetical protein [Deltaproteobacteria bacterium]
MLSRTLKHACRLLAGLALVMATVPQLAAGDFGFPTRRALGLSGLLDAPPTPLVVTDAGSRRGHRDVQIQVPFYSQLEGGHGFRAGPRACFRAAVAMAADARGLYGEGEGAAVLGPGSRIQVGLAEDRSGRLVDIDREEAAIAIRYIDAELDAGRPVVVGASYKEARYNVDGLTDHFVVIDGRVTVGGQLRYTLLDPATRDPERARAWFIVGPEGRLIREGNTAGRDVASRRLEVSMVRRSRE